MGLNEIIQRTLRTVVDGGSYSLGRAVEFRRLTSNPSVTPREYSIWEDAVGLVIGFRHQEAFDEKRKTFYVVETGNLRCPDNAPFPHLKQGDQVRFLDTDGETYRYFAVMGKATSGPGTLSYILSNRKDLLADPGRDGGV